MIRPPAMPEPVRTERQVTEHETKIEIGGVVISAERKAWGPEWYAHVAVTPTGYEDRRVAVCTIHKSEPEALDAGKAAVLALYDALGPAVAAIRAESGEPTIEQLRDRLLALSDRAAQLVSRWELDAFAAEHLTGDDGAGEVSRKHAKDLAALFTEADSADLGADPLLGARCT